MISLFQPPIKKREGDKYQVKECKGITINSLTKHANSSTDITIDRSDNRNLLVDKFRTKETNQGMKFLYTDLTNIMIDELDKILS